MIHNNSYHNIKKEQDDEVDHETQQPQQNQPSIIFGSQPVSMKCPFCHHSITTQIIGKPEFVSIALALLLFSLIPNAIMIIFAMAVLQLTATKKHRCSLCERELGSDGKFLLLFTDEAYSFQTGETGILISKKILFTIAIFIATFLILSIHASLRPTISYTPMNWQSYKKQCPLQSDKFHYLCPKQNIHASVKDWKGFVMKVEDERKSMKRFYDCAVKIFIKMDPTEHDQNHPDLVLTGSSSFIYNYEQVFDKIGHGDQIVFNATFQHSSSTKNMPDGRQLHLIQFNTTGIHNNEIKVYVNPEEQQLINGRMRGKRLRMQKNELQIVQKQKKEGQKIQNKQKVQMVSNEKRNE